MRGVWGWFCVDNLSVCPCLHLHRHSFTPTPPHPLGCSHSISPLHPAPYLVIGDLLYVEVSGIVDGHPGVAVVIRAERWPGSSVVDELVMSLLAALSKEERIQSNQQLERHMQTSLPWNRNISHSSRSSVRSQNKHSQFAPRLSSKGGKEATESVPEPAYLTHPSHTFLHRQITARAHTHTHTHTHILNWKQISYSRSCDDVDRSSRIGVGLCTAAIVHLQHRAE